MIDQQTLNIKALPILQVICLNLFCQHFYQQNEKKEKNKYHTVGNDSKIKYQNRRKRQNRYR